MLAKMKLTLCGLVFICLCHKATTLPACTKSCKTTSPTRYRVTKNEAIMERKKIQIEPIADPEQTEVQIETLIRTASKATTDLIKKLLETTEGVAAKDQTKTTLNTSKTHLRQRIKQRVVKKTRIDIKPTEPPERSNRKVRKQTGTNAHMKHSSKEEIDSWPDFETKFSQLEASFPSSKQTLKRKQERVTRDDDSSEQFESDNVYVESQNEEVQEDESENYSEEEDFQKESMENDDSSKEKPSVLNDPFMGILSGLQVRSETPLYVTMPLIINSQITVPIFLSIGGQDFRSYSYVK